MPSAILATAVLAAREAGVMIHNARHAEKSVRIKEDRSMVTEFDLRAESIICDLIRKGFPHDAILGEEGGSTKGTSGYTWIIDPIDGTHNFIAGIPLYGVSIGVARDDELIAGVIYLPETDELFAAEEGCGAWCNERRIFVSRKETLAESTLSYDSGMRRETDRKVDALRALSTRAYNMRMFGASTILLAYVADGRIDVSVEFDDKPWDFAAGAVIIREAGGMFTSLTGEHALASTVGYAASNGRIHKEVLDAVRPFA